MLCTFVCLFFFQTPVYGMNRLPPQQHMYAYQQTTHTPPLQSTPACVYPQDFGTPLRFESPATSLLSPYSEEYYNHSVPPPTTNPPLPEPGYFTKPSIVPASQPPKTSDGKPLDFGKISFGQPAESSKVPAFGIQSASGAGPSAAFKFNSNFKSNDGDFTFSANQAKNSESLLGLLTSDMPRNDGQSESKPTTQDQTQSQGGVFTFGSKSVAGFSFADAAQNQTGLFGKPELAGSVSVEQEDKVGESDNESTHVEEDEDGPHFEPIVPLPDKVDVKTGEEEEEEMFCNRAKLFRFDTETKEWKERGVGSIKILKHKISGKVRLLMRREQVFKICANHYITADMVLKPNAGSDKSWVWYAMDYADEMPRTEQLAIRFKTSDEAALFKVKFEEAQKVLPKSPQKQDQPDGSKVSAKPNSSEAPKKDLKSQFAKKEGEWDCDVCLVLNKPSSKHCVACQTPNPNYAEAEDKPSEEPKGFPPVPTSVGGFTFGITGEAANDTTKGFPSFGSQIPVSFKFGTSSSSSMSTTSISDPATSVASAATPFGAAFGANISNKPTEDASTMKPSFSFGTGIGAQFAKKEGEWDCPTCCVKNEASSNSCVACQTQNPSIKVDDGAPKASSFSFGTGFGAQFAKKEGEWDCPTCCVRNLASLNSCASCQTQNPSSKVDGGAPKASSFSFGSSSVSGFGAQFSKQEGQWDCDQCLVRNEPTSLKCVSCQAPGPVQPEKIQMPSQGGFAKFAKKDEQWDCDTCLVRNEGSSSQCVSCQTPNPSAKSSTTSAPSSSSLGFSFGTPSGSFQFGDSKKKSTPAPFETPSSAGFSFSIPTSGFKFGGQEPVKETQATESEAASVGSASMFLKNIAEQHREKENETTTSTSTPSIEKPELEENPLFLPKPNSFSFADLANSTQEGYQFGQEDPSFKGFKGAGQQLFKPVQSNQKADTSVDQDEEDMYKTDENDDIQFEPVVQMPEKVDLVTGEEDEESLYCQRVKLFRFDPELSQWKERGVGNLKLLKNCANGRLRVLMRREQVLKVCANHWITTTMNLKILSGSDRAWMWLANDFADGDARLEQLAAKFKTPELADEFKQKFEDCQKLLLDIPLQTPHKLVDTGRTAHLIQKAEEMKSGLKDLKSFLTDDKKIKDNEAKDISSTSNTSGLIIKPHAESTGPTLEWDNYDLREEALDDSADTSVYASPLASSPVRKNLFRFGDQSTDGFNFSFQPGVSPAKSPAKINQSGVSVGTDDEQDTSQEEERDGQYFEPVVPLPDLVDISTGEENEQVLFSHRAKLYRYVKDLNQWKERGIGDLKILQNYDTKRVRLIMRRDQVLKLCANHWISSSMNLEPMKGSEKSWIWSAFDFSEGEGKVEQLAVRFKLQDTAKTFKEMFDETKVAQEKEVLVMPTPSKESPLQPTICGEAAVAILEETTRERTDLSPETYHTPEKAATLHSPQAFSKTVVSPPKFVFGTDQVQKIFGSPPTKDASAGIPTQPKEKAPSTSASSQPAIPAFKVPEGGKKTLL